MLKAKSKNMQAIILAAGMGRRLGDYTKDNTKCMVPVNGVKLIDRLLGQLAKQQLSRVIIVVGYKGKELREYIGKSWGQVFDVNSTESWGQVLDVNSFNQATCPHD